MFDEDANGATGGEQTATPLSGDGAVQLAQAPGEPIGAVEELSGSVTLTRADGSSAVAAAGDPVFLNDVVSTASGSSVEIRFVDGTRFSLGQDGEMRLDQLVYNPGGGGNELDLSVVQGAFTFVTGTIAGAPGEGMEVRMPVGTIGIRGTAVGGGPDASTADPTDYTVVLLPEEGGRVGRVVLTDVNGRSVILDAALEAMDLTSLGMPPGEPVVLTREQVIDLLGAAVENIEDILDEILNLETPEEENPEAGEQRGEVVPTTPNTGGINTQQQQTQSLREVTTLFTLSDSQGLDGLGGTNVGGFTPNGGLGDSDTGQQNGAPGSDGPTDTTDPSIIDQGPTRTVITGGPGDDNLDGSDQGPVEIIGLAGNDTLIGGDGDDILTGGDGDDTLDAGAGDDQVFGEGGNDLIIGGSGEGDDQLDGGSGIDTVQYSSATQSITVNLTSGTASGDPAIGSDTLNGIENVIGGQGSDTIIGNAAENTLDGGAGGDVLMGLGGDDTLIGGSGTDTAVFTGNREDYLIEAGAEGSIIVTDLREGGDGIDTLTGVELLSFADGTVAAGGGTLVNDFASVNEAQQSVENGSAIKTTVTVQAGAVLSFQWNFLDSEPASDEATFKDFAVLVIDGEVIKLADVDASETAIGGVSVQFDEQTGYATFSFTFAEGGSHTIGFAVLNEGDSLFDAGLLIDSVSITGDGLSDGFEGGLEGWTAIGNAGTTGTLGGTGGIAAPEGSNQALLVSNGVSATAVEQFLGLAPGTLSGVGNQPIVSGNVLSNDDLLGSVEVADIVYSGPASDVQDVNGTTNGTTVTFTAADNSWTLVFNLATGDYTFTVLAPLEHSDSGSLSFPFTYTVDNVVGADSSAVLTISVVDGEPVANDDVGNAAVEGGDPISGNVLFNDGFSADGAAVTAIQFGDGDPILLTPGEPLSVDTPLGGSLTIAADGSWTYTPPAELQGQGIVDGFTYIVSDSDGDQDSADVEITVTPSANGNPVAEDDAPGGYGYGLSVDEDEVLQVNAELLLQNDSDPDGDELFVTAVGGAQHGTVTLGAEGVITFTPDADYSGPASFTYTISDGNGGTDTATVHLTVTPANDAPSAPIDSNDAADEVAEDAAAGALVGIVAQSTDVDSDDTLTYSLVGGEGSSSELFQIDPTTGVVSLLESGSLEGLGGAELTITVRATDSQGVFTDSDFSILVSNGAGDAEPVVDLDADDSSGATGTGYQTTFVEGGTPVHIADEDASISDADSAELIKIDVLVNPNPDGSNEQLSLTAAGLEMAGGLGLTVTGNGTSSLRIEGAASPADYQALLQQVVYQNVAAEPTPGAHQIMVFAHDGNTTNPAALATVTVELDSGEPPVPGALAATVAADATYQLNDDEVHTSDADTPASGIFYTLLGLPANGTVNFDGVPLNVGANFTQADIDAGRVTYTHGENGATADSFLVSISDGENTVERSINVTIVQSGAASDVDVAQGDPLIVGDAGYGRLDIVGGGAETANIVLVGNQPTGDGMVRVTGTGSKLSTQGADNYIVVGSHGTGTLEIENGGSVESQFVSIGDWSNGQGSATVSGAGSTLATKGAGNVIVIGWGGTGTLQVEAGGQIHAGETASADKQSGMIVGDELGSEGDVLVSGPGSAINIVQNPDLVSDPGGQSEILQGPYLTIGQMGQGDMTVTQGAQVDVSGNEAYLGVGTGNHLNANDTTPLPQSTLTISAGGKVTVTETAVAPNPEKSSGVHIGDFRGGDGVLSVTGEGSSLETHGTNAIMVVGRAGTGVLNVQNGGQAGTLFLAIGNEDDATGTVNITGQGSRIIVSNDYGVWATAEPEDADDAGSVRVGRDSGSHGYLNITNGGELLIAEGQDVNTATTSPFLNIARDFGSEGDVLVDGIGSALTVGIDAESVDSGINVGRGGTGRMTVSNGGTVTTNGIDNHVSVGRLEDSTGFLTVQSGGQVNTLSLGIGREGTGTVTITGDGSKIRVSNDTGANSPDGEGSEHEGGFVNVGREDGGHGVLQVLAGGVLDIADTADTEGPGLLIARNVGSTGTVIVDGPASLINITAIGPVTELWGPYIDTGEGDASLTITNGGKVTVSGDQASVGVASSDVDDSDGIGNAVFTINGAGSELNVLGEGANMAIAYAGEGQVSVLNGGLLHVGTTGDEVSDVNIDLDGTLNIAGGTVEADIGLWGGELTIGKSAVSTGQVNGNLFFDDGGTLHIDAASTTSRDQLSVTGQVNVVAGLISFNFLAGYLPQSDESFSFLTADELAYHDWAVSLEAWGVNRDFQFAVSQVEQSLVLTALTDATSGNGVVRYGRGEFSDTLSGTEGDDGLRGLGGNDTLMGDAGADLLDGGEGSDTADYSNIAGAIQVNLETGEAKDDNGVVDTLSGIENVTGTSLHDLITGDGWSNLLAGGAGDDVITGRGGLDIYDGGAGDDTLVVRHNLDTGQLDFLFVEGAGGTDTLGFEISGLAIDLADNYDIRNVERIDLTGGEGGSTLTINAGDILTDFGGKLFVLGGPQDEVDASDEGWDFDTPSQETVNDVVFDVFVHTNGAKLYVEQEVIDNIVTSA